MYVITHNENTNYLRVITVRIDLLEKYFRTFVIFEQKLLQSIVVVPARILLRYTIRYFIRVIRAITVKYLSGL